MDITQDLISNMPREELEALKVEKSKQCASLKENVRKILLQKFHSPMFIVYASSLSLIVLISIILYATTRNVFILPILITAIISMVCVWRLYLVKDEISVDNMKGITTFMSFMEVIGVLLSILAVIAGILLVVGGSVLSAFASTLGGIFGDISDFAGASGVEGGEAVGNIASGLADFVKGTGVASVIVAIVIAGLIIAFFVNFSMTFSKNKEYLRYLKEVIVVGKYSTTVHVPQNRSFVFGTLLVIVAFVSFLSNFLLLLLGLSIGSYIFVTAMLFKDIHEAEVRNQHALQKEIEDIEEINKQITALRLAEEDIKIKNDRKGKSEAEKKRNAGEGQEDTMYTAEQVRQMMQFLMNDKSAASELNEQPQNAVDPSNESKSKELF